jgi:hypothetical protein
MERDISSSWYAPAPRSAGLRFGGLREGVAVAWIYIAYEIVRGQATGSARLAYRNARQLVSIERSLGINFEQPFQQLFVHVDWLMAVLGVWYGIVYFVAPFATLVVLYRKAPARYLQMRNALFVMLALAVVSCWVIPMMPPRLMPLSYRFESTSATSLSLERSVRSALGGRVAPTKSNFDQFGNSYAALPSFHVASALWVAAAFWPLVRRRGRRMLLALYPASMVFCVLVTANHWMLDAAASCALLAASIAIARRISPAPGRRFARVSSAA